MNQKNYELANESSNVELSELALFAGAGGGILGGHLLGWRTVCAVEWDAYARAVLRARMWDGCLRFFPIFEDVRFISFDNVAKILFDTRYYEVRQTKEKLPQRSRDVCIGSFHFRGCEILRKNAPSDVGMDENKRGQDAKKGKDWERKSLLQRRKNCRRPRSKFIRDCDAEGDCAAADALRTMWQPWTIPGWKDFDSGASPRLQQSLAGYVAMSKLPPQLAQAIQGDREGVIYAQPDRIAYVGNIDVVSGGFPCVDISCAGKGAGITGEHSGLWREQARITGEVRPRYAFVENSPALTSRGLGTVLGDLASMGYDARWGVVSAENAGAPHKRKRIWIVANAMPSGERRKPRKGEIESDALADANLSHSQGAGQSGRKNKKHTELDSYCAWWRHDPAETPESGVGRMAHGVANRVDRLRCIGNGQVPAVVKLAWETLSGSA